MQLKFLTEKGAREKNITCFARNKIYTKDSNKMKIIFPLSLDHPTPNTLELSEKLLCFSEYKKLPELPFSMIFFIFFLKKIIIICTRFHNSIPTCAFLEKKKKYYFSIFVGYSEISKYLLPAYKMLQEIWRRNSYLINMNRALSDYSLKFGMILGMD